MSYFKTHYKITMNTPQFKPFWTQQLQSSILRQRHHTREPFCEHTLHGLKLIYCFNSTRGPDGRAVFK